MSIPDHIYFEGKSIQQDTRNFLDAVMLDLFRILSKRDVNTKLCKFLGHNDLHIFREDSSIAVMFSRESRDYMPTITEWPTKNEADSQSVQDESEAEPVTEPTRIDISEGLKSSADSLNVVNPVVIGFPSDYLNLQGKEFQDATEAVAELLIEPTLEDIDKENRIVRANPVFRGRDFLIDPELVFVLMEFQEPYTTIFNDLIKPTVESEGFKCVKSDDIFSTDAVIEDIWENINCAALIIAEITSNNANVMYELGICHTIGKNTMMITQNASHIPFNFRHMRVFSYRNDIGGSTELRTNILSVLRHMKSTN